MASRRPRRMRCPKRCAFSLCYHWPEGHYYGKTCDRPSTDLRKDCPPCVAAEEGEE